MHFYPCRKGYLSLSELLSEAELVEVGRGEGDLNLIDGSVEVFYLCLKA